jgi:riboflavin kinase / FMN adenylyltransferase
MQHYWSLEGVHLDRAWLSIGSFDGVHLGHQKIVSELINGARQAGAPSVVITFFPHPAVVLQKVKDPYYLTTPEERAAILGELGVDVVITYHFNLKVASMSAIEFIEKLKSHLGFVRLSVGFNFALGHNREGDIPTLKRLGREYGYAVNVMDPVKNGGELISSSQIRARLTDGNVESAARLLGRPYRISGEVIRGDARGHALGIPTANLKVWAERALPKAGVYVCLAHVSGVTWKAVTNVGVRPTFEDSLVPPRVEAHLLDFDGDLYGQDILLDFKARIRNEQKFPNVQALISQIHQDIDSTRKMLSG